MAYLHVPKTFNPLQVVVARSHEVELNGTDLSSSDPPAWLNQPWENHRKTIGKP
jgi:hypothetical protein